MAKRKPNPVTTRPRVIAGVRVAFVYDAKRLDIAVRPNEDDLKSAGTLNLIRLWAVVGQWADGLAVTNPGWTVNGEPPRADPAADPLDAPDPEDESPDESPGTQEESG